MAETQSTSSPPPAATAARQPSPAQGRHRDEGPPIVPPSGWSVWLTTLTAAAMAFLAMLSLAAGLAAGSIAGAWQSDLAGSATVRLPAGTTEAEVARAVDLLAATEGVRTARLIPRAEQVALLAPWLGAGAAIEAVPLPVMIDLEIAGDGPDPRAVEASLRLGVPGAVYDDHASLAGPLAATAGEVERLAAFGAAMIVAAAAAMVALAARASLAANAGVVRIVRLIGGEDGYITRAFVRRILRSTGIGAFAGSAAATGAILALPGLGAGTALALPLLPAAGWIAALGLGVTVVLTLTGWAVAQVTLGRALRDMD